MAGGRSAPPAHAWRLTRRHLFFLPALVLVSVTALNPIDDNSFLWHVRAGDLQLESGEVLRADPFSFTRLGEPWITQSWLAELGYGWLEGVSGGLGWVPPMIAVAGLLMVGFSSLAVYARVGAVLPTAFSAAVLGAGFLYFSVARPSLLSFVLLAVLAVVLHHHERLGWALVPLLWLWASLHGTWVIALVLIGLEAIRRRAPRLVVTGCVAAVATLLTAHGLETWRFAIDLSTNREALAFISEWQRPDFSKAALWPFLVVVVGLLVAVVRRRLAIGDFVVIVPVLGLGFAQERTVFVALLVLLPYAALGAPPGARDPEGAERGALNWTVAAAVVVAMLAAFAGSPARISDRFPAGLVARLEADNVFHGMGVGGYVIYALGPDRLVYLDDRAELHGAAGFGEYTDATEALGYPSVFTRWDIGEAIVDAGWPLAEALKGEGWSEVAAEGEYLLLRSP